MTDPELMERDFIRTRETTGFEEFPIVAAEPEILRRLPHILVV